MRIVWTEPASRDLEGIGDYIAKDNPAAARRIVRAVEVAVRRLARFPHSGRPGHRAGTRDLVVPRTPYIVPYRVHSRKLEILAVFHGARDWTNTFETDS
ncbi:MAG TPA: type II toxin-antitoxin system RelE/ParE family toxin [Beijerinckiaceae bacterium]|jgi:toxin ParE1/3/4